MANAACNNLDDLEEQCATAQTKLKKPLDNNGEKASSENILSWEDSIVNTALLVAALNLAILLQKKALSEEGAKDEFALVKQCKGKYRNMGWRPHRIKHSSGHTFVIYVRYFARKCAPGKGFSPFLLLSGLSHSMTPKLASLVAMFSAALSSYKETAAVLKEIGPNLDTKTIERIANAFGASACARRGSLVEKEVHTDQTDGKVRRVLISTDGGGVFE